MKPGKPSKSPAQFISLRAKLLVGFTLVFSTVFAGAYYWFYTFTTDKTISRLKSNLENTAIGTARGVDVEELLALYREGEPNAQGFSSDPRYTHQLNWFATVHSIDPHVYPYSFIVGSSETNRRLGPAQNTDLEIIYLVDSLWLYQPDRALRFLEPDTPGELTRQTFEQGITTVRGLYTDQWGSWISAYTPLRDADGTIVGVLGVDIEADYVLQIQRTIRDRVGIAFAITYSTLFGLVYIVSGIVTKPLEDLRGATERMSQGDYEQDLSFLYGRYPDEISALAQTFESMAVNIRSRERFLKAIVEDQTESICRFLTDGTLVFVNDAYCRWLGHDRDVILQQNFVDLVPGEERSLVLCCLNSLTPAQPVSSLEYQTQSATAESTWQHWTIRALFSEDNQLAEFQAVGRDITQRKQAEEALRNSEAKYRALVEQVPAVTYIAPLDQLGSTLYISPQVEPLLGFPQENWLTNPNLWYDQLHPDDRDRVLQELSNWHPVDSPEDSIFVQEYRLITRTGDIRWIRDDAVIITDDLKQPLFFQGVMFDVTARKQAEETLQQLNSELEKRVQQRTAELILANTELQHQASQLQSSLAEKDLLLREVHHRVKNNLQVIASIFSLQSRYITDPQILAVLTDSQHRIRSMGLIHEKLYHSDNLAQIDFADYIQNLTQDLFASYAVVPHLIQLQLNLENVILNLDTAIPCGILINELVSNALKHAFPNQQPGVITVSLTPDTEGWLCLTIQDNGVGLPTNFNMQQTTSLGLRLVSALVRQLQGKLEASTQNGTIFQVKFPLPIENHHSDHQ